MNPRRWRRWRNPRMPRVPRDSMHRPMQRQAQRPMQKPMQRPMQKPMHRGGQKAWQKTWQKGWHGGKAGKTGKAGQAFELYFATSNENKFREVQQMLGSGATRSVRLRKANVNVDELQLWDIREVAAHKARQAYGQLRKPVFVEDTALYINSLNRFPGAFISWIQSTIGNRGLLKLLEDKEFRFAQARSVVAYCDGREVQTFVGAVKGRIAESERGGGWGFDPIFIPTDHEQTYGEMGEQEKNKVSHRRLAIEKFKKWLSEKMLR